MSTELESELHGTDPTSVFREFLSEATPSSVYHLVDLPWPYVAAMTEASTEFDAEELPEMRLLARRETLVSLRQSFLGSARAANLVEDDKLAVREREPVGDTPLIVGEDRIRVPLLLDGTGAAIVSAQGTFAESAPESIADAWEHGEQFALRTPALGRIRQTIADDLGPDLRDDFDQGLARAATQRDPGSFEPVTAAVVVAAANGVRRSGWPRRPPSPAGRGSWRSSTSSPRRRCPSTWDGRASGSTSPRSTTACSTTTASTSLSRASPAEPGRADTLARRRAVPHEPPSGATRLTPA